MQKKSLRFEPGRCQFWFLPWFKETNAMAGTDETENQDVDTNRANAPPGRRQLHSFSPASHLEELRPRSRSLAREEAEALQASMPSTSRGIEETRNKENKQLVEVELSQHVSPEALHQLKRHAHRQKSLRKEMALRKCIILSNFFFTSKPVKRLQTCSCSTRAPLKPNQN